MNGLVVVDKSAGWTSHDVVGRLRRVFATRKVGHAGTLDPMATGVLVVGVNRATRLLGHLSLGDKEYVATVRLGQSTITDDADGEPTGGADASSLTGNDVAAVLGRFTGDIQQVPSSVSAIKVAGVRSYARVRAGEDVSLPARPVTVTRLELTEGRSVDGFLDVDLHVECSSGTYVRALARDIGEALGVGGHLTMLRRTRVGPFTVAEARTLDELAQTPTVVDMDESAARCFPVDRLSDDDVRLVVNGRRLSHHRLPADGPVAMLGDRARFLALYRQDGDDARAVAVFVND